MSNRMGTWQGRLGEPRDLCPVRRDQDGFGQTGVWDCWRGWCAFALVRCRASRREEGTCVCRTSDWGHRAATISSTQCSAKVILQLELDQVHAYARNEGAANDRRRGNLEAVKEHGRAEVVPV